ncbi:MAG: exonuclease domain-containing protein [Saprospiraceae bacterium]
MTKFAIIDIETTGGNHSYAKITEIAIIVYQNNEIIDEFESLINPECSIPPEITRITGITNTMVANAPKFYEIAKKILEITHDCIFVAHNVSFDYSFIKDEFKSLGFSYSRKRLCTVQLCKKYYPGLKSYSLGNLIKHFDIEVKERHRAMEDVKATLQLFVRMLNMEEQPSNWNKLVKGMIHSTRLPTHLQLNDIEALPEECGVYYMADELGRYVYIGKSINIKERILQHFNESSFKNVKMKRMVHSIAYKITGSELMACLLESSEIKLHNPEINKAQKFKSESWALLKDQNEFGYDYYKISNLSSLVGRESAVNLFRNSKSAQNYMEYLIQEYNLCPVMNQDKIKERKPCYRHQLNYCNGACIDLESPEDYNNRFLKMHDSIDKSFRKDLIIIDQGRNIEEQSLFVIQNGFCTAFGYLDIDNSYQNIDELTQSLDPYKGNIESNGIIKRFLQSKNNLKIKYLNEQVQ